MAFSRLRRHTEREQKRRITLGIIGIIAVLAFIALFGLRILIGFSVLVDRIRGGGTQEPTISESLLLPPVLDPLPEATPSMQMTVRGSGQSGATAILYVNGGESKKTVVTQDGSFVFSDVKFEEGINTVSAKQKDDKDTLSDLSNVLTVRVKRTPPVIELTQPQENAVVSGDSNILNIAGKTEENATVSVNGRFVVVRSNGEFSYDYPLSDGDNTLMIVATDIAGNQTTIERHAKRE